MTARRLVAATAAATVLLAGCTTTVTGNGRPGASPSPTGSGSGSATGSVDPTDPFAVFQAAVDATDQAGTVSVDGSVTGAGFGPTTVGDTFLAGQYGKDDDGPLADVLISVGDFDIDLRAVGGKAWMKGPAAFYTAYGKTAAEAAQADGKWALLADDGLGLDVFAGLDTLFLICGPDKDSDDPADLEVDEQADVVYIRENADDGDDGSVTIDKKSGRVTHTTFSGDDLDFTYDDTKLQVTAPDPATVVTIPDF